MLCRARAAPWRGPDIEQVERNSLESHQVAWGGHHGRLGNGDGSRQRFRRRTDRSRVDAGCAADGQLDQWLRNQGRDRGQIRRRRLRRRDRPDHHPQRRLRRPRPAPRPVASGASDAPLTPQQAAACNGCVQVPWALSATGLGFNIPGVKKLNLSGKILAGIYFGKITNWNDPKIKQINPAAKLPNLTITPVFRSDGSGDTYTFTNYLSKISPA